MVVLLRTAATWQGIGRRWGQGCDEPCGKTGRSTAVTNRQTRVDSKKGDSHLAITEHETDAPLIPIAQIERLHQFAPGRVQWVFDQTEREAEHRRARLERLDTMVFVERMAGQAAAILVCAGALVAAYMLGQAGREIAAAAIGTTAVVGLATAFLSNRRK